MEALPVGVAVTVQHQSQGVRASQGRGGSEPRPWGHEARAGKPGAGGAAGVRRTGRTQRQSESKPWSEGATEANPMGAVCLDGGF